MHIQGQEGNNTTLTTCTKMTEEVDRRHGMNGNSSSKGVSEEHSPSLPHPPTQSKGGRLKFYKDGKMILELKAGGRGGEKEGWVAVPHKNNIWVPATSGAPTPTPPSVRQERAASLSVSDDNSSVQSSPWQRDNCWKQATPRKGLGTEMCLMYVRPTCLPSRMLRCPAAKAKRRRPYCPATVLPPPTNGCSSPSPENSVPHSKPTALGKFKFLRNMDNVSEPIVLRVYKKTKKNYKTRDITKVVTMLSKRLEKRESLNPPVNAKISNCKQEHSIYTPKKRMLREMEKVSLEDPANKRSRAKHPASNPQPGPSYASVPSPKLYNGSSNPRTNPPPSRPVSSYSIHSILSITEDSSHCSPEHSAMKKPPLSYSGSSKTESPVSIHSPDSHSTRASHYSKAGSPLSPPDVRRSHYTYASGPITESPSSSPSPEQHRRLPAQPLVSRLPYTPIMGEYYYPDEYLFSGYHQGNPYSAPYLPPYQNYRPPHMLMQYRGINPVPWVPLPHHLLTDPTSREDTSSDLPLNLSKH